MLYEKYQMNFPTPENKMKITLIRGVVKMFTKKSKTEEKYVLERSTTKQYRFIALFPRKFLIAQKNILVIKV